MQPRSDSLFHFTKSIDHLKGILQHGFKPRYSLEDSELLGIEYTGIPMTCFCDIPISRISEHTAFYGDYGIGMTKEWGRRNSLHPLLYAVPGAVISESISTLVGITEAKPRDSKKVEDLKYEASSLVFELIPYVKPIVGKIIVAGAIVE
ncbi:MAG: abortive infection system antitoxin AbiGi family protein [Candidatus Nitrotoga sp.]